MDTSELLRTPLNVFLLALTLVLTFLAAHRIGTSGCGFRFGSPAQSGQSSEASCLRSCSLREANPARQLSRRRMALLRFSFVLRSSNIRGLSMLMFAWPIAPTPRSLRTRGRNAFFTVLTFPGYPLDGYRDVTSRLPLIPDE